MRVRHVRRAHCLKSFTNSLLVTLSPVRSFGAEPAAGGVTKPWLWQGDLLCIIRFPDEHYPIAPPFDFAARSLARAWRRAQGQRGRSKRLKKHPFGLSVAARAAESQPHRQWPMIMWNPY